MVFDIIAYKNIYNKYEGEGNMEALILVLFLLIMILLGLEAYQVKRDRALLQHVVYVNGIRGKSTVTRMIAAGLKSGGWSVFCKTTGTVPRLIGTDGVERPLRRRGKANIREQARVISSFSRIPWSTQSQM